MDELRELARGIHPAILAEGGLAPALKALARRSAIPVELDVRVDGRLPEPIEMAAYYLVSEALTNVAKYARASAAYVEVSSRRCPSIPRNKTLDRSGSLRAASPPPCDCAEGAGRRDGKSNNCE